MSFATFNALQHASAVHGYRGDGQTSGNVVDQVGSADGVPNAITYNVDVVIPSGETVKALGFDGTARVVVTPDVTPGQDGGGVGVDILPFAWDAVIVFDDFHTASFNPILAWRTDNSNHASPGAWLDDDDDDLTFLQLGTENNGLTRQAGTPADGVTIATVYYAACVRRADNTVHWRLNGATGGHSTGGIPVIGTDGKLVLGADGDGATSGGLIGKIVSATVYNGDPGDQYFTDRWTQLQAAPSGSNAPVRLVDQSPRLASLVGGGLVRS